MSKIVDAILNVVRPYFWVLLVIVLFIIFSVAGYYGYQKYAKDVITKTKFADVANADRNNRSATIMMFFVDWCPHCKTAKPEWEKFKAAYDGKQINGYKLKCTAINCTDDSPGNYKGDTPISADAANIASLIQKYNIQSYPTIKLVIDGGETIEFDSKISKDSLVTFVNTVVSDA
jgi:thiol-disulfide isomerase/thioredoxin